MLHPAVRDCIEAVERAFASDSRTPPPSSDAALAKAVERLSDLYTTQRGKLAAEQADAVHLAAKREYFLASDAPKVALALDECAARSDTFARLATSERLRVIDLGAGVGATSVGFIAWLAGMRARGAAAAAPPRVAFHAIELGAPAARAYEEAVHAAATAARIDATITVEARDFRTVEPPPSCDLILCQTALNELLVGERHAAATVDLVTGWARHAPLLVIEPALWTTSRALMALRDDLLARGGAHVVAPCPHQRPCPMLAREGDWCHEARRIDPTPRVARIDRLVGRRDGRALFAFLATAPGAPAPAKPDGLVRLVTDPLGSRGKTERLVCRDDGDMRLVRLLDREVRDGNRLLLDAERGALVRIEPMPPNDRISPEADVRQQPEA